MQTVDELLKAAQRLSDGERRRLVRALQAESREAPIEEQRREAMSTWLELAGQFHSNQIVPVDDAEGASVSCADDPLYRALAVGSSADGRSSADHDAILYRR